MDLSLFLGLLGLILGLGLCLCINLGLGLCLSKGLGLDLYLGQLEHNDKNETSFSVYFFLLK